MEELTLAFREFDLLAVRKRTVSGIIRAEDGDGSEQGRVVGAMASVVRVVGSGVVGRFDGLEGEGALVGA